MPERALLRILDRGVEAWNRWMDEHPNDRFDLRGVALSSRDLRGINLSGAELQEADFSDAQLANADVHDANLSGAIFAGAHMENANFDRSFGPAADFTIAQLIGTQFGESRFAAANFDGANLRNATLTWSTFPQASFVKADLRESSCHGSNLRGSRFEGAKLVNAKLSEANLGGSDLTRADLRGADLRRADLTSANLTRADLRDAYMEQAILVETTVDKARLTGCAVYGIAAWDLVGDPRDQFNLTVTPFDRDDLPSVSVDNLELAQLIYLLTNHKKLRDILQTVTRRGVLILGRFQDGGLKVLQTIAAGLRKEGYVPMIFDFDRPKNHTYTETITTLVGLSRFVVVDLSGPSVPAELAATVPHFEIPFVLVIERGRKYASLLRDFLTKEWVIKPPLKFADTDELLELLPSKVIARAERKCRRREKQLSQIYRD